MARCAIVPRLLGRGRHRPLRLRNEARDRITARLDGNLRKQPDRHRSFSSAPRPGFRAFDKKLVLGPRALWKHGRPPMVTAFFQEEDDAGRVDPRRSRHGRRRFPHRCRKSDRGSRRGFGHAPSFASSHRSKWIPAIAPPPPSAPPIATAMECSTPTTHAPDTPGIKNRRSQDQRVPAALRFATRTASSTPTNACPDTPGIKNRRSQDQRVPTAARPRQGRHSRRRRRVPRHAGRQDRRSQDERVARRLPIATRTVSWIPRMPVRTSPDPRTRIPRRNGCPEARIEAGEIKILQQVKFKTASAEILAGQRRNAERGAPDPEPATPRSRTLRVEGHTDKPRRRSDEHGSLVAGARRRS